MERTAVTLETNGSNGPTLDAYDDDEDDDDPANVENMVSS
jgi:hypothetical protein